MQTVEHKIVATVFPGITSRTLINWTDHGLLTPAINASGSGNRRRYSIYNLVEIGVIISLRSYGLRGKALTRHLRVMRAVVQGTGDYDRLLVARQNNPGIRMNGMVGGKVASETQTMIAKRGNNSLSDLMAPGGKGFGCIIIDIQIIHEYVLDKLGIKGAFF